MLQPKHKTCLSSYFSWPEVFRAELQLANESSLVLRVSPTSLIYFLRWKIFTDEKLTLRAELNYTSEMKAAYLRFWLLRHCTSAFAAVMLITERYAEEKIYGMGHCEYWGLWVWVLSGNDSERRLPGRSVSIAAASCFQKAHKLPGRLCQRSMFAQVQQPESKGKLEPQRFTALHHCPVALLSYCWAAKTNLEQRGWIYSLCEGLW